MRRSVPRKRFADLSCEPLRGRVCCDAEQNDLPAPMAEHNVNRRNPVDVVAQKSPPALARRTSPSLSAERAAQAVPLIHEEHLRPAQRVERLGGGVVDDAQALEFGEHPG